MRAQSLRVLWIDSTSPRTKPRRWLTPFRVVQARLVRFGRCRATMGPRKEGGAGEKMERTVSRWWSMCLHVPVPTFVETRLCNRLLSLPSLYTRLSRISRDTILLPRMKIRERVQEGFFILRIIKEFYYCSKINLSQPCYKYRVDAIILFFKNS